MNSRIIAILGAAVITAGAMGVVAFAANAGTGAGAETKQSPVKQESSDKTTENTKADIKVLISEDEEPNPDNTDSAKKDECKDMVKIMRQNGFKDAARYMQTGDYEKMNEFMENMTEAEFRKMTDLMQEYGYESMAKMMESMGREGMIKMHASMSSMHGEGADMNSMHSGSPGMMSDSFSNDKNN